ncbi:site-specific DNA-methyltransferase [Romboutsia timonensis]|uniref:site-specific DNA-methyltransferase n=1 Tax=Romboutsia timonensis TaxID=1776391 RepID=UPI002A81CE30|nr:site-specific DNA-methyltransferase [Romboutsia timonensis]MDY3958480.1 site-specific DNA-methyltransferase [Romboutsia timonensis]
MNLKKVDMEVGGLLNDNVRKLESIFPSVIKDGEVDFEELKELLGDFKEVDKEKYEMNWVGKKEAKKIALTPLYGKTLKYIEGDGKNEGSTENLYIEGDNLEVLKLLQNSYYGKVKMIYIDPPYNTGNDFIYNDNFKVNKNEIEILEEDKNEYGERLIKNQKSESYYHSRWMSMMYSRLIVSKNLLSEDGLIFISIDDNEVDNLRKVGNEVFGENNFIGKFIKQSKVGGGSDSKHIAREHEYVLIYSKNFELSPEMFESFDENYLKRYKEIDKNGRYFWDTFSRPGLKNPIKYEIEAPDGSMIKGEWIRSKKRFEQEYKDGIIRIIKKNNGDWSVQFKQYLNNHGKKPRSMTSDFGGTIEGKKEMNDIFKNDKIFSYPKSKKFISKLMQFINISDGDIVLDFFSGSATTAHSIMQLNAEDNGNRKYIMVQLPEVIEEKSEAYKAGYKNICEIGKERIRRAGDKILEENKDKEGIENLDIGFKVFRVENSNIRWKNQIEDGQIRYDLDGKNIDDIDFVPGTKDIDVVYEILLRHYGIPLTAKIEILDFIGKRTYAIQDSIIVCLETQITKDIVDKISELDPIKVIFRDSAFGEDISLKQNSVHRLNLLIEKKNKNTTHVVEFI